MLTSLHIENYALIDHLDIEFENGFSVITGETGAGKSILLGAIGLLLGQRADLKMIKAGASRCTIEASFDLSQYDFADYFKSHDLDFDGKECIIRRELTSTGKSRAFINDTPTALTELKELGDQLIDVHSQHQNLLLNKEDFQLSVLDALANDGELLAQYKQAYKTWCALLNELHEAQDLASREKDEQDYLSYQVAQLTEANLSDGEEEELEQELSTLSHAEDIKSALFQVYNILDGDERGLLNEMRSATRLLEGAANVHQPSEKLAERLDSCHIELRDIANEVEDLMEQVEYDPQRMEEVNERLSLLHSLKQKFHAEDITSLIAQRDELAARLSLIENSDEHIRELQQKVNAAESSMLELAKQLTFAREKAAIQVEKTMCERLTPLGMPDVQFRVEMTERKECVSSGIDKVTFLFSANKGVPMLPLSQVASGGEISRLMLALKALTSGVTKLPTIIFDEIDTGVSGHIAEQMAAIMQEMGDGERQVISITHLPQIAAMGRHHYRVFKTSDADTTTSHIVRLSKEERIEEIARMLSGSTLTQAAIDNARALLGM